MGKVKKEEIFECVCQVCGLYFECNFDSVQCDDCTNKNFEEIEQQNKNLIK